jgi:glycosyltransferase involved in cell wall biosynthesis
MNSKKNLFLFTSDYPFSTTETFLENEIPILANNYATIFIFTIKSEGGGRKTPINVKVEGSLNGRENCKPQKIAIKNSFFILKSLFIEFWGCNKKIYFLKNIRRFNSQLIRAIYDADFVFKKMESISGTKIFCSVWLNDWALALAVMKQKGKIKNFVIKCGGYDIYDERHEGNYLPFRYFIYKNASAVFPNSISGEIYLKSKNMFPFKIKHSFLGTHDHGINPFLNSEMTIVSCSRLIPLKRVHLIIEILKHIDFGIKWVHFGGGPLLMDLKQAAKSLPKNIVTEFKGETPNHQVLQYYSNNSISLFITTSETEGLPISLQEAISFGIPVIGTNVGGISEVINTKTGLLINNEFDPKEVALLIKEFIFTLGNNPEFRVNLRQFWKDNFEANTVYSKFCKEIEQYAN